MIANMEHFKDSEQNSLARGAPMERLKSAQETLALRRLKNTENLLENYKLAS